MITGVIVHDRKAGIKLFSFSSHSKWPDLHFRESQWIPLVVLPLVPLHTVSVRRPVAPGVVVVTVQVGAMTVAARAVRTDVSPVPPATFVPHCTWAAWPPVVVLVSSAELLCYMRRQWITFTQQIQHRHISLNSTIVSMLTRNSSVADKPRDALLQMCGWPLKTRPFPYILPCRIWSF